MIKKNLLFLVLLSFSHVYATDIYERFVLNQEDITSTLNNNLLLSFKNNNAPADISFCCADIKFSDDGQVKFCECGDGVYMSFRTANVQINDKSQNIVAPYWGIFWHYLKQFGLPIWQVGDTGSPNAMALEELGKLGGQHLESLRDLENSDNFKKNIIKNFKKNNAIKNYQGIIVYRAKKYHERDDSNIIAFKKKYPEFLFVNDIARPYVINKNLTYQLFTDARLSCFVPATKTYPQKYSPNLIQEILTDFACEKLVVKPPESSESFGVNIIDKTGLDDLLKLIIDNKTKCTGHRCFTYWRTYKGPFAVAEYAPSKIIYKNSAPYDPTMRIVFMLHHDQETITINVIAGFWKIPVKSLNDKVSLTDKHVTIAHAGSFYSGIPVDPEDWLKIKNKLYQALPELYMTMLQG